MKKPLTITVKIGEKPDARAVVSALFGLTPEQLAAAVARDCEFFQKRQAAQNHNNKNL